MPLSCKLTLSQREQIPALYLSGKNTKEIGRIFSVDDCTINYHLQKAGIKRRTQAQTHKTCFVNNNAFDELTPEVCYWLGLFFADGTMSKKEGQTPVLALGAAERDKDHVYRLAAFLKSTYKIGYRPPIPAGNGIIRSSAYYTMTIGSQRLYDRLKAVGYDRHNSYPIIKLRRSRDFWRGAVDGDGSVFISAGRPRIVFAKGKKLTDAFLEYVRIIYPKVRAKVSPRVNIFTTNISGLAAYAAISEIYYPGAVALCRKAQIAKEIIDSGIHPQSGTLRYQASPDHKNAPVLATQDEEQIGPLEVPSHF
jgi:hypothetical protein